MSSFTSSSRRRLHHSPRHQSRPPTSVTANRAPLEEPFYHTNTEVPTVLVRSVALPNSRPLPRESPNQDAQNTGTRTNENNNHTGGSSRDGRANTNAQQRKQYFHGDLGEWRDFPSRVRERVYYVAEMRGGNTTGCFSRLGECVTEHFTRDEQQRKRRQEEGHEQVKRAISLPYDCRKIS